MATSAKFSLLKNKLNKLALLKLELENKIYILIRFKEIIKVNNIDKIKYT